MRLLSVLEHVWQSMSGYVNSYVTIAIENCHWCFFHSYAKLPDGTVPLSKSEMCFIGFTASLNVWVGNIKNGGIRIIHKIYRRTIKKRDDFPDKVSPWFQASGDQESHPNLVHHTPSRLPRLKDESPESPRSYDLLSAYKCLPYLIVSFSIPVSTAQGGSGNFKDRKPIGGWLLWMMDRRANEPMDRQAVGVSAVELRL